MEPTDQVLREIGARLRKCRERAGLTQEQAATQSGIDYKRWQRLEGGQANPTVKTLVRAATALGITFWELVRAPKA